MDFHDTQNPYAAPLSSSAQSEPVESEIERTRNEYLSHEASVRAIGLLYLLGGGIWAIYCVIGLVALLGVIIGGVAGPGELGFLLFIAVIVVGATWLQIWIGLGLRRLNPSVRTPATVLSVVGLLGVPIGTIISAYVLWLLQSAKGKVVFSNEYQEIIRQTPHIRYKTSIIVWIFLGLLVVVVGLAVLAVIVGSLG